MALGKTIGDDMDIDNLINKEEIDIDGVQCYISCMPAVQGQECYGEIVKFTSQIGDVGMTFLPISIGKKMLEYAAYYDTEYKMWKTLETETEINKAFQKPISLIKLEAAMIRKNFDFLFNGSLLKQLEGLRAGISAT